MPGSLSALRSEAAELTIKTRGGSILQYYVICSLGLQQQVEEAYQENSRCIWNGWVGVGKSLINFRGKKPLYLQVSGR